MNNKRTIEVTVEPTGGIIIEAVAQGQRSRIVVPASAVAAIDAVAVVNLVVDLDVELVIRSIRQCRVL